MSNEWETCPPLLEAVEQPVTLLHNQYLFVMEINWSAKPTKVQRYNVVSSEWTFIKDLPIGVCAICAAAVVYKNRLTVVGRKQLMSYEQESDTWSVKEYGILGFPSTALIVDGELCTCIEEDEKCSLMSYNEQDNVWNVKINNIPDMLDERYGFMV